LIGNRSKPGTSNTSSGVGDWSRSDKVRRSEKITVIMNRVRERDRKSLVLDSLYKFLNKM
jgi:hypothetical protein